MGEWAYSDNEEEYRGRSSTPDGAIAEALDVVGHDAPIWIGEVIPVDPAQLLCDPDVIFDNAKDAAFDIVGDAADGWLDAVSAAAADELEAELQKVWCAWLKKHQLEPSFYSIGRTEQTRTPTADDDEVKTCGCDGCEARLKVAP